MNELQLDVLMLMTWHHPVHAIWQPGQQLLAELAVHLV